MKRFLIVTALLVVLASCDVLPPMSVEDGSTIRYCNDPLLEAGEPCITDDRATLLGVGVGAIVFLSSSTIALVRFTQNKQNKRGL